MAREFLSLAGFGENDTNGIQSIQRIFAGCLAEDNLRANLNEEIDTVIEEVACIVEKGGCVPSRDEKQSF